MLPVNHHEAVALGNHGQDALEASAGGHGIFHNGVEVDVGDVPLGVVEAELVEGLPLAFNIVDYTLFGNRLVGAVGVDFIGRLGVQPAHRAAQAHPFRRHHADVGGGEGLAQGAGIEGVNFLILQFFKPVIPLFVVFPGHIPHLQHLFLVGVDGNLHPVDNGGKLGFEFGVQNFADILHAEALCVGVLGYAHPHDVPLGNVPQALAVVGKVVDAALQNRLKVFLHFASVHVHHDAYGQAAAGFNGVNVRAHQFHFAVFNLVLAHHADKLEARGFGAAELNVHILLADGFTLEGGAHGDGHVDFNGGDFDAPHFQAGLHNLVVIGLGYEPVLDLFVFRQFLVGDDREAYIDGAHAGGILNHVVLAQVKNESQYPAVLIVLLGIRRACRNAAEHHAGPQGEVRRVNHLGEVAQGEGDVVNAQFYILFHELLDNLVAEEKHQALGHEAVHHFLGGFAVLGPAHYNRLAGDCPVNQLGAVHAHHRVAQEAGPGGLVQRIFRSIPQVANRFNNFSGIPGCLAALPGIFKVPVVLPDRRPHAVQNGYQVAQGFYFLTAQATDNRQVIGRIGIGYRMIRAKVANGLAQQYFGIAQCCNGTVIC
ncbi:hypothetical protein DCCM_0113 [Desulfocucumis palustris]|uniref:Uncharacterized protein n=1 Tax=Desulfocucumis palustris TaxID=1898651 RepID=A0A2L2X6Z6_9FIRM|nr:hypothetical protein DCCM_0113 [Desulfocucumis palustris]